MEISREQGVALWRQIAGGLEGEIRQGRLRPGERLPTEHDLAERFGVNRHTVRRAVAALEESGLVRAEQGRGTFVEHSVLDYAVGRRTRFTESLDREAVDPGRTLLRAKRLRAGAAIGEALGIGARGRVELLELLGTAGGRPLSLAAHYLPSARFAGIAEAWSELGSVTAALRRFGVEDYTRRITRVTARLPEEDECEHLAMPRQRPVLVTESVNVDSDGTPIEYGNTRFAADRVQLVLEP